MAASSARRSPLADRWGVSPRGRWQWAAFAPTSVLWDMERLGRRWRERASVSVSDDVCIQGYLVGVDVNKALLM